MQTLYFFWNIYMKLDDKHVFVSGLLENILTQFVDLTQKVIL